MTSPIPTNVMTQGASEAKGAHYPLTAGSIPAPATNYTDCDGGLDVLPAQSTEPHTLQVAGALEGRQRTAQPGVTAPAPAYLSAARPEFIPAQVRPEVARILQACATCEGSGFDLEHPDNECAVCSGCGLTPRLDAAGIIQDMHAALKEIASRLISRSLYGDDIWAMEQKARRVLELCGPDPVESREYDETTATYVLNIHGQEYSRTVEVEVESDPDFGADADGRRGICTCFCKVGEVRDIAPPKEHLHHEIWLNMVPSADDLLQDWEDR